jgi:LCP family protein required for cell wall assembly
VPAVTGTGAGTMTGRARKHTTFHHEMTDEPKPYRVYRGGRKKGKVPVARPAPPTSRPPSGTRRRRHWLRWTSIAVLALLVLAVLWGALGFRAFAGGVEEANARLPRGAQAQLAKRDRSILSEPTTILVIGTDGGRAPGRGDANRSDSMLLVRVDPETHRVAYLSIPRDLQVEIPGYGTSKINAANQIGGPALTLATVKALTGLPIDHVLVVDFDGFRELIDAVGGIEVNVPKAILSNRFDCPYKPARCANWDGWRFEKGTQHMDGRRALVYSRIRTNQLDPSDSDITRGNRQQIVADAVGDEIASFGTFLRLPFMGGDLAAPLATDLSAWELAQLGWVRFRSGGQSLRCRLGGDPSTSGGESVLLGSEDNVSVVSMWLGRSAPLAPPKGTLYGAGCTRR